MTTTTVSAAQLAEGAARAERTHARWAALPLLGIGYLVADRHRALDEAAYGARWNREALTRIVGAQGADELIAAVAERIATA